jgi:hypothetical protein
MLGLVRVHPLRAGYPTSRKQLQADQSGFGHARRGARD